MGTEDKSAAVDLTMGERTVILHLVNLSEDFERTSSNMRKVNRVKWAIQYKSVKDNVPVVELFDAADTLSATFDGGTLGWLWDLFGKFKRWPSQLSEGIESVEDKLRAAVASLPKG